MVPELNPELYGPDETVLSKSKLSRADILTLDRLAVAAWPAPEREINAGWLLRHAHGISRRANSAAPFMLSEDALPDDVIAGMEDFYRARDLPPRVQISPVAEPDGIDSLLAARGYEIETPVTIMISGATPLADGEGDARGVAHLNAPPGWWNMYLQGYSRDPRAIVAGARTLPVFATVKTEGDLSGIGLGVMGGGWMAIFGMWTDPDYRRRGIGEQVIRALARFAVDRGGIGLYLQVENDNPAACRLYEKLGFRAVYSYHYRTLWTTP